MKIFNAFLLSLLTVLIFFALLIAFGWLDTGNQSTSEILRNIFAGNYLFFSVPIFLGSLFAFGIGQFGTKGFLYRLLLVLLVSFAFYYAIAKYLITRLD